jgi:hypoxanthine phosphoribosyltransferase
MAQQIETDLHKMDLSSPPVFIGVLNGAFMFTAQLVSYISLPVEISFVKFSSYIDTRSSGKVVQLIGFSEDIRDRDVLLIEDIVDTGLTFSRLVDVMGEYEPRSLKTASLLFKPQAMQHNAHVDYLGFEIPNEYVVGYGMDFQGMGRNLPGIFIMK